jgi:hypothetical protein
MEGGLLLRQGPGLLGAVAVGYAAAEGYGGVRHDTYERYARREWEMKHGARPRYVRPAEPAYVAELEQLAQLERRRLITNDEFQAKKRQLLGI